ncbi:cytochrome c [Azonexus sp. R2A61]|uniref:cytochrome c n=1 Tax=Azonexus sp. R2A61 TaxID=2744443 RepID=UPI001F3871CB|nr:cytochrome c [Azonexus sp. R2A61]
MKTMNALLAGSLVSLPVLAADPWGDADPHAGKLKHEEKCVACHVRLYGGDGSKMYTRDGRLMSTKLDILQRTAACNSQVKAGWFPDEEAEVAAYLNQIYYKFKD